MQKIAVVHPVGKLRELRLGLVGAVAGSEGGPAIEDTARLEDLKAVPPDRFLQLWSPQIPCLFGEVTTGKIACPVPVARTSSDSPSC